MKRETLRMLKGRFGLNEAQLAEVLATDAEVKRLRVIAHEFKEYLELHGHHLDDIDRDTYARVCAALKPQRKKR